MSRVNEIYCSGTEADNWAIKGSFRGAKGGKHVITSAIEHPAIWKSEVFATGLM